MKSAIQNNFFVLCSVFSLVVVLITFIFSSHASAQDWTNHHQTIHCTVNVEQTFLGYWREISLKYTAANDSGTFIVYKCISCNSTKKCDVWAGFDCTIINNQSGQGSFSGKDTAVAIFLPGIATQQNSCEEVYQKADILLQ